MGSHRRARSRGSLISHGRDRARHTTGDEILGQCRVVLTSDIGPHGIQNFHPKPTTHCLLSPRSDVLQVQVSACERFHFASKTGHNLQRGFKARNVSCPGVTVQRHADKTDIQVLSLFFHVLGIDFLMCNYSRGGIKRGEQYNTRWSDVVERTARFEHGAKSQERILAPTPHQDNHIGRETINGCVQHRGHLYASCLVSDVDVRKWAVPTTTPAAPPSSLVLYFRHDHVPSFGIDVKVIPPRTCLLMQSVEILNIRYVRLLETRLWHLPQQMIEFRDLRTGTLQSSPCEIATVVQLCAIGIKRETLERSHNVLITVVRAPRDQSSPDC
mmetsp:Transcript_6742/g.27528  ORF Transcript_6742/g.27528 Transcript_6742/m.27528 type:complete len:328 (+) Transcript_6742:1341-2324(+)